MKADRKLDIDLANLENNGKDVTGVYLINDSTNGKVYTGSASNLRGRLNAHRNMLARNDHHNKKLQRAYNAGNDLVITVTPTDDRETAFDLEQSIISGYHDSGLLYNTATDARNAGVGYTPSLESREKMRVAHLGKKLSEAQKEKIRIANTGKKLSDEAKEKVRQSKLGSKASDETREKLRISHLGIIPSSETLEKRRIAMTGKTHTQETKDKMRISKIGKKRSPEACINIGLASKGRTWSDAAKENMRQIVTGRKQTPEAIEKSRLARLGIKRTPEQIENRKCTPTKISRGVIVNGVEYISIAETARSYNISEPTVKARIESANTLFSGWHYK